MFKSLYTSLSELVTLQRYTIFLKRQKFSELFLEKNPCKWLQACMGFVLSV